MKVDRLKGVCSREGGGGLVLGGFVEADGASMVEESDGRGFVAVSAGRVCSVPGLVDGGVLSLEKMNAVGARVEEEVPGSVGWTIVWSMVSSAESGSCRGWSWLLVSGKRTSTSGIGRSCSLSLSLYVAVLVLGILTSVCFVLAEVYV